MHFAGWKVKLGVELDRSQRPFLSTESESLVWHDNLKYKKHDFGRSLIFVRCRIYSMWDLTWEYIAAERKFSKTQNRLLRRNWITNI